MPRSTAAEHTPPDSTTARAAEVLLAFAGTSVPLGITEIARSTRLSKAVVHRIVQALCRANFLTQDPDTRKYQVGMSALALADSANQSSLFRRYGMEVLADLAEETGETTTISGRIGHRRIYVAQVESRQLVRISVQVGAVLPLTVGASGAAILAFLANSEIEAAMKVPAPGEYTTLSPEQLRARLREVAEQGFAHTESERVKDSTSYAAPVRDRTDEVIGCVSIAALSSRLTPEREVELAHQVKVAAERLTARLRGQ